MLVVGSVGLVVGFAMFFGIIGGESVDRSQKALTIDPLTALAVCLVSLTIAGTGASVLIATLLTSRSRASLLFRIVFIAVGLFFAAGMVGSVAGLVKSFGAIGGESVEPSQKARILAEGISEAMNCTAFALVAILIGGIGTLGYRLVVRRKPASP